MVDTLKKTLHVDENGAAGASDGVVEDEDARRLAVHAAGAGADVGECAVEEDGASELLAAREACRFGDFDEALWRCGVGIEDFCGERMGDLAHGALDEFGAGWLSDISRWHGRSCPCPIRGCSCCLRYKGG